MLTGSADEGWGSGLCGLGGLDGWLEFTHHNQGTV